MAVTLTEKGQITIPLAIRKRLGLKPGMRLVFDEQVPYLKATREVDVQQMRTTLGCLHVDGDGDELTRSSEQLIEELRGPVE